MKINILKTGFPKIYKIAAFTLALAVVLTAIGFSSISKGAPREGNSSNNIMAVYVPEATCLVSDSTWDIAPQSTFKLTGIDFVNSGFNDTNKSMSVDIKAVYNGTGICFRYNWKDATADTVANDTPVFADALAMQIPLNGSGGAGIQMGSQSNPVNIIFWRADLPKPQNIIAGDVGTVQKSNDSDRLPISHYQAWTKGEWTVIITRPMAAASDNMVTLNQGVKYSFALAYWNGAESNRDGFKYRTGWNSLTIQ